MILSFFIFFFVSVASVSWKEVPRFLVLWWLLFPGEGPDADWLGQNSPPWMKRNESNSEIFPNGLAFNQNHVDATNMQLATTSFAKIQRKSGRFL